LIAQHSSWILNGGASRHPGPGETPFITRTLTVMETTGGESSLVDDISGPVLELVTELTNQVSWGGSPGDCRSFGQDAAAIIETSRVADGQITHEVGPS
jgi:hypothetical protein